MATVQVYALSQKLIDEIKTSDTQMMSIQTIMPIDSKYYSTQISDEEIGHTLETMEEDDIKLIRAALNLPDAIEVKPFIMEEYDGVVITRASKNNIEKKAVS